MLNRKEKITIFFFRRRCAGRMAVGAPRVGTFSAGYFRMAEWFHHGGGLRNFLGTLALVNAGLWSLVRRLSSARHTTTDAAVRSRRLQPAALDNCILLLASCAMRCAFLVSPDSLSLLRSLRCCRCGFSGRPTSSSAAPGGTQRCSGSGSSSGSAPRWRQPPSREASGGRRGWKAGHGLRDGD